MEGPPGGTLWIMNSTGPRLTRRALRTASALLPLVAVGAAAVVAMAAPASATNEFIETPTLTTEMSGVDGGPLLTDYAYVTGVTYLPTGTVTFSFYGPDDATCSTTPVFVDTQPLVGLISNPLRGEADSAYYTYTQAGVYRSIASYSGDANNVPVVGACNDPGESVVAEKFEPAILSEMSPDTAVGSPLFDTAWIADAVNPTAAMHFAYYAPSDPTCTGTPVFEADAALVPLDAPLPYWVNATHKAVSPAFTATVDYLVWLGGEVAPAAATRRDRIVAALDAATAYERDLGERLLTGLSRLNSVRLYGPPTMDARVPTFAFTVEGHHPDVVAQHLADRGVFAWSGHFYAVEVIARLGLEDAGGLVRVGLCHYNTAGEVDRLLAALGELAN